VTESALERISRHGNALSMRYHGSPVFLVGGALSDPDPRDVDVVVLMPDELFWCAYGWPDGDPAAGIEAWDAGHRLLDPPRIWWRWARDCTKQSLWLTKQIGGPLVDFKTLPVDWAVRRYKSQKRHQISGI
jgi:hypothetical protein